MAGAWMRLALTILASAALVVRALEFYHMWRLQRDMRALDINGFKRMVVLLMVRSRGKLLAVQASLWCSVMISWRLVHISMLPTDIRLAARLFVLYYGVALVVFAFHAFASRSDRLAITDSVLGPDDFH